LAVNTPDRLRVEVLVIAALLPFSVRVRTEAPSEVRLAAPHEALKPFGNPEAMLMVAPALLVANATPPTGVAVTVIVAVERDAIEIACGDTCSRTPGAACIRNVTYLLAKIPSPATVTTAVVEAAAPVEEAVSVRVSLFVLMLADGVAGLADHFAVTPGGSPLTE
jgi:hypothetical protein